MNRGARAEIDFSALRHNLAILRKIVRDRTIIGVVKADAYGHGACEVAGRLLREGVSLLAVAYTEEAAVLRKAGIEAQILVLFDHYDLPDYFTHNLIPVIYDIRTARSFSREARKRGVTLPVHLKIDTGMGRLGFQAGEAVSSASEISCLEGIRVAGILSHFSEADLSDRLYALHQIKTFRAIRKDLVKIFGKKIMAHMANSAAILSLRDAHLDAVRPGLMLYGYSPFDRTYGLRPVMKITSRILSVRRVPPCTPLSYGRTFVTRRKSKIAVVPVGYADGFNRLLSNNGEVLVGGRRVPVVGRVCMDVFFADITDVKGASEGDEVVVVGQQGKEQITARDISARINSIPYEVLTSLGRASRREYIK